MRVKAGYCVYVIKSVAESEDVIREAITRFGGEAFLTLRPFTSLVNVNDLKMQVAVPQLTLLTPEPLRSEPDFIVEESVWVEAKPLPEPNSVNVVGEFPEKFVEVFRPTFMEGGGRSRCVVIGENSGIDVGRYISKYLNTPHVVLLSGVKVCREKKAKGEITYLWSTHPILTGLNLVGEEIEVKLADIAEIPKIPHLLKPLVYINGDVLVGELP
ncbi:MAG: hypothetical protein J7L55_03570, partial [Desulfurococcales archaeon]|nr:hypothetical protein [Desulfurococcales archaeon]